MTPEERDFMIKTSQKYIEMGEILDRLNNNSDFTKLVENFVEKEPVRLTKLLADATLNMSDKAENHRREIKESLIGIARFAAYLRHIKLLAERAKKELEELNKDETPTVGETL